MKDALCRPGNLSLDEQTEREDLRSVDDEYCHFHSEYLRRAVKSSEKQPNDRAFLQEFVNFVQREDPKVLPAIEALLATGTQGEAVEWLRITESEFARMRSRLSQLNKCFLSGNPVPRKDERLRCIVSPRNHFAIHNAGNQDSGLFSSNRWRAPKRHSGKSGR
jgi:hypothetical protein